MSKRADGHLPSYAEDEGVPAIDFSAPRDWGDDDSHRPASAPPSAWPQPPERAALEPSSQEGQSQQQALEVASGTSTARQSFVSARSVPQISLPDSKGSSRHPSPKPPPLNLSESTSRSQQPPAAGRTVTFQQDSDSDDQAPLEVFNPLNTIDAPLHSPATVEATSTENGSGHNNGSSKSVLLGDPGASRPPDSAGGGWRVPLNQLRPDTADLDEDDDYPGATRTFDAEHLSDSGKSSDAGDDVFAFHRPTTTERAAREGRFSRKRKRVETSGTPGPTAPAAPDYGGIDFSGLADVIYDPVDPANPQPFSGRNNLNNSPFTNFRMWRDKQENAPTQMRAVSSSQRPTTQATGVSATSSALPPTTADTVSAEVHTAARGRRMRASTMDSAVSATTLSDESDVSDMRRRHSLPVTELTGDLTVPDGHTTWGDGRGGDRKDVISDYDESNGMEDWEEDSPYAEVRASVSNIDDPEMPALTLRAYVIGIVLCMVVAAGNTFLSYRNPSPQFPVLVVQVVAYPIGKFMAWILPIRDWYLPRWLGGRSFSLNPCPFNVKEHTIIVMMATVAILPAYAQYSLVATEKFYDRPLGIGFNFVYVLASQVTGLSMAGLTRRYAVFPASMLWPGVLVTTTILNTLHADSDLGTGGMPRQRFFLISSLGAFFYYFLPGYFFQALSYFNWACWIAPLNHKVNQLMGISTGMGMGILTFDWSQIAWIGSPLAAPWWAQMNIGLGFLIFYWIIVPSMYYSNVWNTKYLPIMSLKSADRFGSQYNVSKVLTPDHQLNTTAYAEYSPVYLTASFSMTYMLAFALTTGILVYTVLVHGPRIWRTTWGLPTEPEDVHMKLMRKYREVPDWWYAAVFCGCFIVGVVSVRVFHTGLPVWGYLVAVLMALVYLIPITIIFAMSNIEVGFNLIAELIPGYAFPGKPFPGMVFKTFAVQTLSEAMYFVRDMKLGHYMKVPPRSMFICQVTACTLSCFVQVGVKEWMFRTIPDLCADNQKSLLVCSNAKTMFTASIVWGLIGPARLFSKGGIYNPQLWMLLVGAVLPVPFWYWSKKHPESIFRHVNPAIVFAICLSIPPATGINLISFLVVGFTFQFWIRRYRFAWWSRYNYVLSAGLDVGTLASGIFIFLCLRLPNAYINWWGNNVYQNTADWQGTAVSPIPKDKGYFGPSTWKV